MSFVLADAVVQVRQEGAKAIPSSVAGDIDSGGGAITSAGVGLAKKLIAGVIAFGIGQKIVSLVGDSINLASDLNETVSKSQAIFGDQAAGMLEWSKASATSLGLSQSAALSASASFGDMFSQIGFTGDAAADMSKSVVQAAADLGSFSNLDTADVSDRIAAAFRGEYDSLQAVIPNINAARVEQEAMAASGKTNAAELTAQEKATAVLAIVQQDGARAMGDFAKTSGGFANQQKIAAAQVENLKTKIGDSLLPAGVALMDVFNGTIIPMLSGLADTLLPKVAGGVESFASWLGQIDFANIVSTATSFSPLLAILQALSPIFPALIDAVSPLLPVFQELGTAVGGALSTVLAGLVPILRDTVIPALTDLMTVLAGALGDTLTQIVESGTLDTLADAFLQVANAIVPLLPQILELVPTILELLPPLLQLVSVILPPLADLLGFAVTVSATQLGLVLQYVVIPVITFLVDTINQVIQVITIFVQMLSGGLSASEANASLSSVGGVVGWLIDVVQNVVTAIWNFVNGAILGFRQFAADVGSSISQAIGFVAGLPGQIMGFFSGIGSWLVSAGRDLINGFIDGIKGMIGAVGDAIGGVLDFAASFFPHSPAKRGPFSIAGGEWENLTDSGKKIGEKFGSGFDEDDFRPPIDLAAVRAQRSGSSDMTSSTATGGVTNVYQITATIDAKNVTDFARVVGIFDDLGQAARTGKAA